MVNKGNASGTNILLWTAAAFACTFAANHKCNFVKITDTMDENVFLVRGLWKGQWQFGEDCKSYKTGGFYIDRHWNSARFASVLADVLACFALLASCAAASPAARNKGTAGAATSVAIKACIFQGLTLLFLTSSACYSKTGIAENNSKCELSQAGNLSIAATVLWFVAALAGCCTGAVVISEAAG